MERTGDGTRLLYALAAALGLLAAQHLQSVASALLPARCPAGASTMGRPWRAWEAVSKARRGDFKSIESCFEGSARRLLEHFRLFERRDESLSTSGNALCIVHMGSGCSRHNKSVFSILSSLERVP